MAGEYVTRSATHGPAVAGLPRRARTAARRHGGARGRA
jgi:hypothetical protein